MKATDNAGDHWFTQKDAGKQRGKEEKNRGKRRRKSRLEKKEKGSHEAKLLIGKYPFWSFEFS